MCIRDRCREDDFVDFFEVLIIHMNVVVFFEAIIDRAVVFQIWIVWIDVLFRNIGLVEDIGCLLYTSIGIDTDAPNGGLCVAYFDGKYPTPS